MLNWIAIWVGDVAVRLGGPLQNTTQPSIPISNDIASGASCRSSGGPSSCRGSHIGIFIALGALVVYWVILNRTTLGFEVRAVGFNPEAARYGGISVARNYFLAMAIAGAVRRARRRARHHSAGSTGSASSTSRRQHDRLHRDSRGLLGRNTAVGILFSALLFGALINGTSAASSTRRSSGPSSPAT